MLKRHKTQKLSNVGHSGVSSGHSRLAARRANGEAAPLRAGQAGSAGIDRDAPERSYLQPWSGGRT